MQDDVRILLNDIRQAIAAERKYYYTNIQGKTKQFSAFLKDTLQLLKPYVLKKLPSGEQDQLFLALSQYANADLGFRMRLIERIESILFAPPAAPKPKPVNYSGTNPEETDIQFIKGIGPNLAVVIKRAGLYTVKDLLYYFPKRYLDYQQRTPIAQLVENQDAMVIATVQSANVFAPKGKKVSFLTLVLKDESGTIPAVWIFANAKRDMLYSLKSKYTPGQELLLSGKVKYDSYRKRLVLERPDVELMGMADTQDQSASTSRLNTGRMVPVYPLSEGLNHKLLRKAVNAAIEQYLPGITDQLPLEISRHLGLMDLQQALAQMHFPDSADLAELARKRLVFDEFFKLQLRLALSREMYRLSGAGVALPSHSNGLIDELKSMLPYQLTSAQQRVLQEVDSDLNSGQPMYRLLQGDVGSGKTIVALLCLMRAIENRMQGALMAPTEILAEQHYRNFVKLLTPLGLRVGLLLGKNTARQRKDIQQGLLNGQIHLAVGTHALIQDDVQFDNLGMIVVDEQHRFGVRQRLQLKNKGDNPHMLSMSATPIPRTLAMSLHGDMDVSVLDELPPGRSPIKTALFQTNKGREQAYQMIKQQILLGRQAYIVYPLIEESETLAAKAATDAYEYMRTQVFAEQRVGLLHGKLSSEERDMVMGQFLAHQLDILVCTTVIEVGVDVPNATVMMIENAERFGLSQLHQLRGRVGRSSHQSYCVLMSDSRTEEVTARLNIMTTSEDGFYIAEKDLELRGPGEFLGTRQSGLPSFSLANLLLDKDQLQLAKQAAFDLVQQDPRLSHNPELKDWALGEDRQAFEEMNVLTAG